MDTEITREEMETLLKDAGLFETTVNFVELEKGVARYNHPNREDLSASMGRQTHEDAYELYCTAQESLTLDNFDWVKLGDKQWSAERY